MSQKIEIYTLTGKKIGVMYNMYPEQYTLTGKKIHTNHTYTYHDNKDTYKYEYYSLTGKKINNQSIL